MDTFQKHAGFMTLYIMYVCVCVCVVRKAAIIADVSRMPARRRRACGFKSRRIEEEQSASTSKLGENKSNNNGQYAVNSLVP